MRPAVPRAHTPAQPRLGCPARACAWGMRDTRGPEELLSLGAWTRIGGDGCMESSDAGFRRAGRPRLQAALPFSGCVALRHAVIK